MRVDNVNNKKVVQGLAPLGRAAAAAATIDTDGYNGVTILVEFGAEGITLSATDKVEIVVEHSDASGSGFAAVVAADLILPANKSDSLVVPGVTGIVAVLDNNAEMPATYTFGYRGSKRYVRVTIDFSGTHGTATPCAIHAILESPEFGPAA